MTSLSMWGRDVDLRVTAAGTHSYRPSRSGYSCSSIKSWSFAVLRVPLTASAAVQSHAEPQPVGCRTNNASVTDWRRFDATAATLP